MIKQPVEVVRTIEVKFTHLTFFKVVELFLFNFFFTADVYRSHAKNEYE